MPEISIVSWNIAGGKLLSSKPDKRADVKKKLNDGLNQIINYAHSPNFILLQEIVCFSDGAQIKNLIEVPEGYYYKPSIALDTKRQTYREKWEKFREAGGWSQDDYLALGTGLLWRKDMTHCAIWDFDNAQVGENI